MKKIVICGGHLTPALALIEGLENRKNIEILFFGRMFTTEGSKSLSAEFRIITGRNISFIPITAGRLQRKFTKYLFLSLLKIPVGFIQSLLYLLIKRPNLIISFGGYLSVPVVYCGWLLGIESIAHEQASVPGLATRINSPITERIFLTWQQSAEFFDDKKAAVIGNLTRKSISNISAKSQNIRFFLKSNKKFILVLGGNQGSHFLNNMIYHNVGLLNKYSILHQIGTANWENDWGKAKKIKNTHYFAVDYINPEDIAAVLQESMLVISRAGANTIWDLGIFKKPSVLIPLPASSGGEQFSNAKILENAGMAKIYNQDEINSHNLSSIIEEAISNLSKYKKAADKFYKNMKINGLEQFIKYLVNII